MVLRIKLPGAKLKNIDLNVDKQKIVVQDPTYRLATYLPYPSDDSQGKAQWLPEKEILSVTLPILRSDWCTSANLQASRGEIFYRADEGHALSLFVLTLVAESWIYTLKILDHTSFLLNQWLATRPGPPYV